MLPGHSLSPESRHKEKPKASIRKPKKRQEAGEEKDADHEHEEHHEQEMNMSITIGACTRQAAAGRAARGDVDFGAVQRRTVGRWQYLDMQINKGKGRIAQAVAPAREVGVLMNSIVGPMRIVLLVLTVLVVIVAGISILVSIYNSMTERSHDIAVMRALGASRKAVMGIVLAESILLSLGGGLIGILLGHGLIGLASPYVVDQTGIALEPAWSSIGRSWC